MIKNFFNVAGADAVKRIAEWIRHKFYTKSEIDDMLSAGMKYKVVNELPATGEAGTFYLVPKQSAGTGDVYDEYIYVDGSFEHIGSTEIDLSNYYTKAQTDNLLGDKVDKVNGKGLSTNDFTTAEKTKLGGIEAGAEVNVQSDWNQGDSTKDDYIKNKPTLRQPSADGTAGQYLKSNGSGNAPSWETMDSSPTANSTKAVTSGGVKTALDGKQASISITTKTDDAGDNDKVIMQANGVTNTTTFVRRSLTNIRDWLLKKLIPEELLKWGGLNGQGERTALGVIDSTLINNIRANRVAWLTADHFTVEYSRDGGTTWQNSRHIDDIMNWTSSPTGTNIYIGDADAEHIATSAYMTRITLTTAPSPASSNNYTFYCKIVKMCFYVATMGSTGCKLNVYLRTQANVESDTDTWVHVAEDCTLTGWSGWNIINFPSGILTYGNNKSAQYGQIRMVFSADGYSGNGTTNYGLSLQRLRVYAPDCRGVSNSLANYDSPFAFYSDRHVVFPSTVTATQLIRSGGTDSQLLVADGSVISMPIAIAKGGTGATTAFKAEYNINTNVRNNHLTGDISDTSRLAFCSTAPSTTNGVFAGYRTMSQVWTWIKTHFDSSPTSGSSNGITSGAVYTAINGIDTSGKVNLQPDFTASQIDYSAGNVGKWQKVLRFPEGADLVINMKKTAMGSDATSTLWFSSSSMGDSYTSLFGNHSVRFVHDGGYVFLVLACRKSTYEPIESYTFQIAHSSVPMSDIVAVTDASPITATPKEPNIVYRAPITTGAVSFNVNSSGAGSVSMSGHNDFLGNMTSEATNGVTVTMSGATEGQIYRFVFTRNITGGVTFKQSNVAYCTISGDVNAGDTITLTAISNTADGWLYEQESAGIESSDGSNIVEYNGSTADVRVNWDKLPARVVMNVADDGYDDDKNIAIGNGASSYKLTGDEEYPYAYTTKATFEKMKVDGGAEEYTHAVTAGTTYSIARGSVTTSFTPAHSGYAVILKMSNSSDVLTTQYPAQIRTATQSGDYAVFDKTLCETEQYVIVVITISAYYAENIGTDSSYAIVWILSQNNSYNTACGYGSRASGSSSSAFGLRARANDASSLATGVDALASDRYATAAGDRARAEGRYSSAYGSTALANGEASSAIGASTNASGRYSTAIGHNATAKNYMSTAVGNGATASGQYTEALGMSAIAGSDNSTALGSSSKSYGYCSTAVGNQTRAGLSSTDADRPYRRVKNFTAVQFAYGGDSILAKQCETDDAVTIAVNGNNYTLTPPDEGYTLVVLNDANAQYINGIVTGYLKINGAFGYYLSNTQAVSTEVLSGNYCAVWIKTFTLPSEMASLSFVAYYTDPSSAGQYQTATGYNSEAVGNSSVAVGHNVTATRDYQVVIGSGNLPDYDALFIVGAGGNVANAKKNILTVDYREQLQVRGVRTQVASMTTSGTISGVNNIYLIGSGCTVALPSTGEEGQVLKVCAEGNCTVGGVSLEAGKFREYVCAGGAWYTRE